VTLSMRSPAGAARPATRAIAVSVTAIGLLVACSATAPTSSQAAFYFPRHAEPLGNGDHAVIEGVARLDDGCLSIVAADGAAYLPLWPADTELGMINSLPAIMSADGELLVEVGDIDPNDRVGLAGFETSQATAEELVGEIPERCQGDRFWVVENVLTRP
jgi:hypothetical protein